MGHYASEMNLPKTENDTKEITCPVCKVKEVACRMKKVTTEHGLPLVIFKNTFVCNNCGVLFSVNQFEE